MCFSGGFEAELSRNDELDALAAELGVDIGMAATPGRGMAATPGRPKHQIEDNLFSKVGFDGLGGTARIRKPLRESFKPGFCILKPETICFLKSLSDLFHICLTLLHFSCPVCVQ